MRYPGGKSYIAEKILVFCEEFLQDGVEWVDVFTGGLTMTIKSIKRFPQIKNFWINDKDPGVACIWTSYIKYPNELKAAINSATPSVELFYALKDDLAALKAIPQDPDEIVKIAKNKILIHQCSYSGLGLKGGAQGGRTQTQKDKIDTNWNPKYQHKKINEFQKLFANCNFYNNSCTDYDFSKVILDDHTSNTLLYLDPPYYEKGKQLYYYYFTDEQHRTLAKNLQETKKKWVLSYDDCEFIRNLYSWARIETIRNPNRLQMLEEKTSGKRSANVKNELVIMPT